MRYCTWIPFFCEQVYLYKATGTIERMYDYLDRMPYVGIISLDLWQVSMVNRPITVMTPKFLLVEGCEELGTHQVFPLPVVAPRPRAARGGHRAGRAPARGGRGRGRGRHAPDPAPGPDPAVPLEDDPAHAYDHDEGAEEAGIIHIHFPSLSLSQWFRRRQMLSCKTVRGFQCLSARPNYCCPSYLPLLFFLHVQNLSTPEMATERLLSRAD